MSGPAKRRRIAGESRPGQVPPPASTAKKVTKPVSFPAGRKAKAANADQPSIPEPTPKPRSAPNPVSANPLSDEVPKANRWRLIARVTVPILSLVLAVVSVGWAVNQWQNNRGVSSAHQAAADVAASSAETIFSYDYVSLQSHMKDAKKLMTSKFAKDFDTISPALDELAPQRKIQVKAETREAAPIPCADKCSRDKVTVLIFIDQARLADGSKNPTVFGNRITMDMVKHDGHWLVSNIGAL